MATWHHIEVVSIALVVATVWLTVVAVVLALCRAASRGDRALCSAAAPGPHAPESARLRLVA
jgi:hypothetical protein